MRNNNNTKDVAYLGSTFTAYFLKHLIKSKKESVFSKPIWLDKHEGTILVFDCSGTR